MDTEQPNRNGYLEQQGAPFIHDHGVALWKAGDKYHVGVVQFVTQGWGELSASRSTHDTLESAREAFWAEVEYWVEGPLRKEFTDREDQVMRDHGVTRGQARHAAAVSVRLERMFAREERSERYVANNSPWA